jgi:hypothetical protein
LRSPLPPAALAASAIALAGCNVVGQVQAGPVLGNLDQARVGGGQADLTTYWDIAAADGWLDCHLRGTPCIPPERATRFGISAGVDARALSAGFTSAAAGGAFYGTTDATRLVLVAGGARAGVELLHGRASFAGGPFARVTAGFPIRKTYDPHALILCRELTYLTFTLQGTVDDAPRPGIVLPAVALMLGITGLHDSGAPSDRDPSSGQCPR